MTGSQPRGSFEFKLEFRRSEREGNTKRSALPVRLTHAVAGAAFDAAGEIDIAVPTSKITASKAATLPRNNLGAQIRRRAADWIDRRVSGGMFDASAFDRGRIAGVTMRKTQSKHLRAIPEIAMHAYRAAPAELG